MADDDDDGGSNLITKLVICLIAAAAAAVVVTVYHCITTGHILTIIRRSGRTEVSAPPSQPPLHRRTAIDYEQDQQINNSSIENSLAELIPSHKYEKGGGEGGGLVAEHDGMCPVCLSDFEEGEILRTLPECMHTYHATCIDMWLYSHSNCPMCRTNAAPSSITDSPRILMHLLESSTNHTSETPPPSQPPRHAFPLPLPAARHNVHNFRV